MRVVILMTVAMLSAWANEINFDAVESMKNDKTSSAVSYTGGFDTDKAKKVTNNTATIQPIVVQKTAEYIKEVARSAANSGSSFQRNIPCDNNGGCFDVIERRDYKLFINCHAGSAYKMREKQCISYKSSTGKYASGCSVTDTFAHHYSLEKAAKIACDY